MQPADQAVINIIYKILDTLKFFYCILKSLLIIFKSQKPFNMICNKYFLGLSISSFFIN